MTRLLIVDSELECHAELRSFLIEQGFEVDMVRTGEDALDTARRALPNLVLADVQLPSMNGYALLRRWREDDELRQVPFVFWTKILTSPDEALVRELGAAAVIGKQCAQQQVLARIREIGSEWGNRERCAAAGHSPQLIDLLTDRLLQLQRSSADPLQEHARAETALREELERLRLSIQVSNMGLWDWDLRTNRVVYSREWHSLLGYDEDDVEGWRRHVHPEDMPIWLQRLRDYLAAPEGAFETDARMLHRDGTYRWIRIRGQVIRDAQGAAARMLGSHQDITERRLAREWIVRERDLSDQIVNSLPGVFYLISQSGQFLRWNDNFERVTGHSAAEIRSLRSVDFVHPKDRERVTARLQRYAEESGPTEAEVDLVTKDGRTIPYYFLSRRILFDGGPCLLGVGLDISERKRAEAARAHLEAQLRQAQKMDALGTLAGGIAHDFNNLLSVIIGNAQMARDELQEPQATRNSIAEILRAGQRARDLVKRILAFGRPHEQQLRPLELGPVLEEAVRLLRSTLPASVELVFRNAPRLPHIRGDASQIQQVILNLATNAWHAMEGRSGRVEIRSESRRIDQTGAGLNMDVAPGEYVCLTVSDTGKGMDAATRAKIFEPFFTTKAPGEGTGLGLAVVHGIVRHHAGSIVVESERGEGSTFRLYFPVSDEPLREAVPKPEVGRDANSTGEQILYLDDEESLVYLAERFLGKLGYRVKGFTRAVDALAAFKAAPKTFDLVITDSNMPGMSGVDVVREMKRVHPAARIVLTSGYLRNEEIEQARALGVHGLVLKPNTLEEFGPLVRRLLAHATDGSGS